MTYKFKIGQVVLFNGNDSIFAKLITKYNMSKYGKSKCIHAGIIAGKDPITNEICIFEATREGFVPNFYHKEYLEQRIADKSIIIRESKVPIDDVFNVCGSYMGIGYGFLDILMIGFYWLTGFRISITKKNRLICSEAVVRVLYDCSKKQIDFEEEFDKPYDFITPMDIYYSKYLL